MIKLVASDIDGTILLDSRQPLEPIYLEQIRMLGQYGVRFVAASGRQYTNLRRLFAPVADEIAYICENGSLVIYDQKIYYQRTINRRYGSRLMQALLAIDGCEVLLSGVETCYMQPKDPAFADYMRDFVKNDVTVVSDITAVPEEFLKISAYFKDGVPPNRMPELARLAMPVMHPVVSGLPWVDFLLDDCNKGTALRRLQQQWGILPEKSMCFGDNENDIDLLKQCGIACAMRHGNPKLHPYATHLVHNVADFLDGFLSGLALDER